MPFDPSQYVYRPRPLQQYDFGQAFRDLIEARFGRERIDEGKRQFNQSLAEQQAGRQDVNTRFSAGLAAERSDKQYAQDKARHERLMQAVNAARTAVAKSDWNTADALGGQIAELGGYFDRSGPEDAPIYTIRGADEPGQAAIDFPGMRNQIFGAGQPTIGQSFEMRAPPALGHPALPGSEQRPAQPGSGLGLPQVPSFQLDFSGPRNPMDLLPGASAAALPEPQSIDDLPSVETAGMPSEGPAQPPPAPPATPELQLEQVPDFRLDASNPRNPFDPFRLDAGAIGRRNMLRIQPYLDGTKMAFAPRFQDRVDSLNQGVGDLKLDPIQALGVWQKTLGTVASQFNSETAADAANARMAASGANQAASRAARMKVETWNRAKDIINNEDLKETKRKLRAAEGGYDYLKLAANGNGQAATQLVATLYRMNQSGVMTNEDFDHASEGAITVLNAVKQGLFEKFIQNGIDPDKARAIKEFLDIALARHVSNIRDAQDQLWTLAQGAGSDEERITALSAIRGFIPREYWSDELKKANEVQVPQKRGPMDASGNYPVAPGESLGVAPLPSTLDGGGSARASVSVKRSRPYVQKTMSDVVKGKKRLSQMSPEEQAKIPAAELKLLSDEMARDEAEKAASGGK